MSKIYEKQLQNDTYELIKNGQFVKRIKDARYFLESQYKPIKKFTTLNILSDKYANSVKHILTKLNSSEEAQIIGNKKPTNISLDIKERLYPDIIVRDYDNNFFLLELKVGKHTEREAITELLAYLVEIRNHLPYLNNHEISLIIISESFNPLLTHAALQLLSFFDINIMCLYFEYKQNDLCFQIYNPVYKFTKNEKILTKKSFTTYSMCLYSYPDTYKESNKNIKRLFKKAESMILESANRINSNGFLFLIRNNDIRDDHVNVAKYYITLCLINPFEVSDKQMLLIRDSYLSRELYNTYYESEHHLQNHFYEIVKESELFLNKFYYISYESPVSYNLYEISTLKWDVDYISCNMWGEFGAYMRGKIYGSLNAHDIINGEVDHTNPFIFLDALEDILGDSDEQVTCIYD